MPQMKMSSDGRFTIPASVRRILKLKAGDKVTLRLLGTQIFIEKKLSVRGRS